MVIILIITGVQQWEGELTDHKKIEKLYAQQRHIVHWHNSICFIHLINKPEDIAQA